MDGENNGSKAYFLIGWFFWAKTETPHPLFLVQPPHLRCVTNGIYEHPSTVTLEGLLILVFFESNLCGNLPSDQEIVDSSKNPMETVRCAVCFVSPAAKSPLK